VTILKKFGSNLRRIRLSRNLSQMKLSELSDIHYTYISQIENGRKSISLIKIYDLAKALEVNIIEFFEGIDSTDNLQ